MDKPDLDDLATELMDEELPSMSSVLFKGATFSASLSKGYVETERVQGVRSILLCPNISVEGAIEGDQITVDSQPYFIQGFDIRGKALTALILGRGGND